MALVGMSAASKEMGEEERGRVAAEIAGASVETTAPYADGEGLVFEISSNVATARR